MTKGNVGEVWMLDDLTCIELEPWCYVLVRRDVGFRDNMWRAMRLQSVPNVHEAGTLGQINLDSPNVRRIA